MGRKGDAKYNTDSLAVSLKYYLDNTGVLLTQSDLSQETGFKAPAEIDIKVARALAEHVLKDMQTALIDGKRVYLFPEIGSVEAKLIKPQANKFMFHGQSEKKPTRPRYKLRALISTELSEKLSSNSKE